MSIARAFTTRRVRQQFEAKDRDGSSNIASSVDNFLHRSKTTKAFTTHGSIRNKISGPVELTHTTNMLSYNAPSIFPGAEQTIQIKASAPTATATAMTPSPSASSISTGIKSDDDASDGETTASTPPTSPDTPFPRDDDKRAMSPEPNHLSCYFMAPKTTGLGIENRASSPAPVATSAAATSAAASAAAPTIPQRAPSHTKKSYDSLGRHRSVSRMSEASSRMSSKGSFSFSRSSSASTSTSIGSAKQVKPVISAPLAVSSSVPFSDMSQRASASPKKEHKKDYSESHPFGQELAKVSELVEEFSIEEEPEEPANPLYTEEERELQRQGLKKYSAESYISDIQSLMSSFFAAERPMAVWI